MYRAVMAVLPRDNLAAENPADRIQLHIDSLDCEYHADLQAWFAGVRRAWDKTEDWARTDGNAAAPAPAPAAPDAGIGQPPAPAGPVGPGWIVEVRGHHFRNEQRHKPKDGENFVHSTLIRGLLGRQNGVRVRMSTGKGSQEVSIADLGIGFPVVVEAEQPKTVEVAKPKPGMAASGGTEKIKLEEMRFKVQFAWQPTVPGLSPPPVPQPN